MDRQPVKSSAIRSVGFVGTLEIEFESGGVYRYHDVPAWVYQGLLSAESIGAYYCEFIRGKYAPEKVT